jgi:diguanylate cyclase (GGDEF)-like protein
MSKLVIASGDEPAVIPLGQRPLTIGRAPDNDIVLRGPNISRRHCRLESLQEGVWSLEDLRSTNGTYLNGEPVSQMALEHDDRILIGQMMLMYVADEREPLDALETSGVVFPWRPVREPTQPTPAVGIPAFTEELNTDDISVAEQSPTRAYPIALQPSERRTAYLKELLPRLSRAGQDVASELDLGQLMATIMAELAHWTGCERAQLLLYDEDTGMLQPTLGHRLDYETLSEVERRYMDRMVKRALDRKQPVLWSGLARSVDRTARSAGLPPGVDSGLCLPLTVSVRLPTRERRRTERQRRALGAIYLDSPHATDDLEEETLRLLEAVCAQAVAALQNAQLHYQATTDQMTRLYNRMFMWQLITSEVQSAHRDGANVGLILLDLDHLKQINDTHGHAAGDEVIIRVARRLRHAIRADDLAARWGGEEFLILLPDQPLDGVVSVAQKVLHAICDQPIGTQQHRVSASAGVALYPDHGLTPDELIRHADEALYHSKDSGRNRLTLYRSAASL